MNILNISTTKIALFLSGLTFVLIALFLIFFKVEDKYISLINYYNTEVIVNIKDRQFKLQPFDTLDFSLTTRNPIKVEIYNSSNEKLKELTVSEVSRNSQLFVFPLSNFSNTCYITTEAGVDQEGNVNLVNKTILTNTHKDYIKIDLDFLNYRYIYPGKIPSQNRVSTTRPLNYVLPINCTYVNDDAVIASTIKVFQEYNAQDQRKYYEEVKKRIDSANDLESIKNAIPSKSSKYFVSDKDYLITFE